MMWSAIDFLAVINLLGIVQGFLLAVLFLTSRRGNQRANRLLGLLLLLGVLTTLEIFASYTGLIARFPALINITEPLDFIIGPLTYFYTLSLIKPDFKWKNAWLHFIPAVVFLILRLPYLLQSSDFKLYDVHEAYHQIAANPVSLKPILWFPRYHFGGFWMDLMVHPFMLVYQGYSLYMIYQFTRKRNESFLNSSNRVLRRVSWLMVFLCLVQGFIAVISFVSEDDLGDIYIATLVAGVYYVVSYWVLRDSYVFSENYLRLDADRKKYEKSSLDEEAVPRLLQKLLTYMEADKPYLNGNLTLSELADQLRLSTHHLSQLINEKTGKNFSDFVNEYRVATLKQKLQNPAMAHLKIEELAFASGFNSKSVFNTAFKRITGVTPSQYRRATTQEV